MSGSGNEVETRVISSAGEDGSNWLAEMLSSDVALDLVV